jgi:pyrroline-5-carboxylate reductase
MDSVEKIGFIGGGNMAEALIKGLLGGAFPAERIVVSEPGASRCSYLRERYSLTIAQENLEIVSQCDLIVLAIKPQICREVLSEIAPAFKDGKLLISILAGVPTHSMEGYFGGHPRLVRAMPNTPALVGEGATALCAGRYASSDDLLTARRLFETVGKAQILDESLMDAVTGLSGSGPAYVFTIIEALADGGVREGLPRDTATALAVQTVLGAARLVQESAEHTAVLRDRVCSPGGTTIAGVKALEEGGIRISLMRAVEAATARSRELGGK